MTLREFLADRLSRIVTQLLCAAIVALFLRATGTQPGVLAILAAAFLPAFGAAHLSVFLPSAPVSESWNPFWRDWIENICLPSAFRLPKISMKDDCLT